jgi:hypothetical protein
MLYASVEYCLTKIVSYVTLDSYFPSCGYYSSYFRFWWYCSRCSRYR